jgi:hypothetical protein
LCNNPSGPKRLKFRGGIAFRSFNELEGQNSANFSYFTSQWKELKEDSSFEERVINRDSYRFQVQVGISNHGSVTRMARWNHSSQLFLKRGKHTNGSECLAKWTMEVVDENTIKVLMANEFTISKGYFTGSFFPWAWTLGETFAHPLLFFNEHGFRPKTARICVYFLTSMNYILKLLEIPVIRTPPIRINFL